MTLFALATCFALCVFLLGWAWREVRAGKAEAVIKDRMERQRDETDAINRANAAASRRPDAGELERRLRDGTF